jgi:hypothetical protein
MTSRLLYTLLEHVLLGDFWIRHLVCLHNVPFRKNFVHPVDCSPTSSFSGHFLCPACSLCLLLFFSPCARFLLLSILSFPLFPFFFSCFFHLVIFVPYVLDYSVYYPLPAVLRPSFILLVILTWRLGLLWRLFDVPWCDRPRTVWCVRLIMYIFLFVIASVWNNTSQ